MSHDRYHTYQGQFMPGGRVLQALFPNPRPGYTTLGAHNSPALGLLASTNRKTRHTELKQGYHQATQQAHARFLAHSFTHTETLAQQQQWIDWAIWMCAKFRTSSAVEGRNGYLSRLHHSHRGFGTNLEGVDSHS